MRAEHDRQDLCAAPDPFAEWNTDVISLFEDQVERAPEATALIAGDTTLGYAELNRRANRLARHLVALGVAPRSLVGICVERSFESIIGVLAILKCGAAYVPIDHKYPHDRIRFILRDSAVAWTLTVSTLDAGVRSTLVHPVYIDGRSEAMGGGADAENLGVDIAPAFSAYVMYTSGTSGAPKGVAIPHSGISRLVRHSSYIDLDSTDVILHHATCSFDAATFEMWAALLNGGTLVIHSAALDLDMLGGIIERHGITALLLTTSVFHLVAEHRPDCVAGLTKLVTGGDVMQARAVKKMIAHNPHLIIINGYGPTENTTFTCCHVITRDTPIGDTVPIGKPISGTNVVILDDALLRVGIGEPGQLYTSGLGLGNGYLNRDDLNRQHFIDSPYPELGPVLYRTGDLVRQDSDGNIHFIGRVDRQVKIRGFRIEPGEVEHVINLRTDVAESVVMAEPVGATDDKRLVAYVKRGDPRGGASPPEIELDIKRDVAARLPHYMVPSRVHVVDRFPLTHNGKIDKERLRRSVEAERPAERESPAAVPAGSAEVVLDAWRRQLQAPALAADASVYDHGASSLTAMVVQHDLNQQLQCTITPAELSMAQTPLAWADIYDRHLRLRPRE